MSPHHQWTNQPWLHPQKDTISEHILWSQHQQFQLVCGGHPSAEFDLKNKI